MKKSLIILTFVVIVVAIITLGVFLIFKFSKQNSPQSAPVLLSSEKSPVPEKTEVDALTFYDWWTSPSESAALNSLIAVFSKKYPNTAVVAAPVVGGAGFKMFPIITSLVSAGEAPDAFQMHAGYEAEPYFKSNLLDQIDYIWQSEGLEDVMPKIIQSMNQFEGHYYSVPVDVHRGNVIWYNKALLSQYNINPNALTTWDDFFKAADKLQAAGIKYPIQMGESWTASQVFETIVASQGIDFYEDFINGKVTKANDPRLINSLTILKKYLSYVNLDSSNLTWDEATRRIINKTGAFNLMGDWANGEFKLAGMKYGVDYGAFLAPGTQNMYGLIVDTFQHPKGINHPTNSDRWLETVASLDGQDAFNPIKGSISPRSDSDAAKYDAYQKSAMADFKSAQYYYPSIANGSGAPGDFELKMNDVMSVFVIDKDVDKAAASLSNYTASIISEYDRVWSLK
jgi:glucose/mannose transport system substrate-binding protein